MHIVLRVTILGLGLIVWSGSILVNDFAFALLIGTGKVKDPFVLLDVFYDSIAVEELGFVNVVFLLKLLTHFT